MTMRLGHQCGAMGDDFGANAGSCGKCGLANSLSCMGCSKTFLKGPGSVIARLSFLWCSEYEDGMGCVGSRSCIGG